MGSLFSKIFLSFWIAALLLGAVLFALVSHFRGDALQLAQQRLESRADTVTALLADGGTEAVEHWLYRAREARGRPLRLWVVDGRGEAAAGRAVPPPLARLMKGRVQPGTHRLRGNLFLFVAPLNGQKPPLYLLGVHHIDAARRLPVWVRLVLAVAVTGLVSFGLASLLTRRLRRLRGAAQALAAGDLSVRVGAAGGDEVAALARDFDSMAEHIRDLLEAQRRLLSDVSHELRSPLARLKVALELARRGGDIETALARIERETDRLETLLADVLSLARLESGRAQLQRREVAFNQLLAGIVQDADFEAQARQRRVRLEGNPVATVRGDPAVLRAAVENVVRNAVRHTAEGSIVEVMLGIEAGRAVVTVRDHGPGVPEQELGRLFEPFARVGEARDRASGGYGLGLAISHRALAAHGGDIVAANAADGGLVVTLRLPLAGSVAPWGGGGGEKG